MTKRISILFLVILLFCFSGCAETQNNPSVGSSSSPETTLPPETTLFTEPPTTVPPTTLSLPSVSYLAIINGYLLQQDGQTAIYIGNGYPETVSLEKGEISFSLNGGNYTIEYSLCQYGIVCCTVIESESLYFSCSPVHGSDRYLMASISRQGDGYACLIDTKTGEVTDPMAALADSQLNRFDPIEFSPDGKYAVFSCMGATSCYLLDCETGALTQICFSEDPASITGYFLNNSTLLVLETAYAVPGYCLYQYDIPTGTYPVQTQNYTAKDKTAENYLCFIYGCNCFAKTYTGDYLTLVDMESGCSVVTEFTDEEVKSIFCVTPGKVGIIVNGILYLADLSGSIQAVCQIS